MASQTKTYVIPTIGTKGRFTFKSPFDNEKYNGKEYTVVAIRELKELSDSGEKPYEGIYQIMSISQAEYENDLINNVPVLVITDDSGKYLYVPADLVEGMPDITGVKYQEIIVAASLGLIPLDFDIAQLKTEIIDTIKNGFGVTTTVEEVRGSAIKYVTETDHKKYQRLLTKNKGEVFSYRARCKELDLALETIKEKYRILEQYVISKIEDGTLTDIKEITN